MQDKTCMVATDKCARHKLNVLKIYLPALNIFTSSVPSFKPTFLKTIYGCFGFIPVTTNKEHNNGYREWNGRQAFTFGDIVHGVLYNQINAHGLIGQ